MEIMAPRPKLLFWGGASILCVCVCDQWALLRDTLLGTSSIKYSIIHCSICYTLHSQNLLTLQLDIVPFDQYLPISAIFPPLANTVLVCFYELELFRFCIYMRSYSVCFTLSAWLHLHKVHPHCCKWQDFLLFYGWAKSRYIYLTSSLSVQLPADT